MSRGVGGTAESYSLHLNNHASSASCELKWMKTNGILDCSYTAFFYNVNYLLSHRLFCKWSIHRKSPSITTNPNTVQNESKLIDLVMWIELTRAILMPRFLNFVRNSTILFACFYIWYTWAIALLCVLQAASKIHVPIYPYPISEGKWNCSTLWPSQRRNGDSQDMLPNINIINMRKWMGTISRKISE